MKFKKHESGRSMVEMLGVLAIIGVLSVGGIAGYTLSMRRHRANGIMDIASKYALIIYSVCQQKVLDGSISSIGNCSSGYIPSFNNAGIGSLPAGLKSISNLNVTSNATTGIDTIQLSARFDDDRICKAVASSVGSVIINECDFVDPFVAFEIKQN